MWAQGQLGSVRSCSLVPSALRDGPGPAGWGPWCGHMPQPWLPCRAGASAGPQVPCRLSSVLLLGEVRSGGRGGAVPPR